MGLARHIAFLLFLSIAVVGLASAAGDGTFSIEQTVPITVGQIGAATLYMDNTWQPPADDVWVTVSWDGAALGYISTDWRVGDSVSATLADTDSLFMQMADLTDGYPNGRIAIADINFKALTPGSSALTVTIDHVRSHEGTSSDFTDLTPWATATQDVFTVSSLKTVSNPGDTVFIGENDLDITATGVAAGATLGWFQSGADVQTAAPDDTLIVYDPTRFYVQPGTRTGAWYNLNNNRAIAINVTDPSLNVHVWDVQSNKDVTGTTVTRGHLLSFRIDSNLDVVFSERDTAAAVTIGVRDPTGIVYSSLLDDRGDQNSLIVPVTSSSMLVAGQGTNASMWDTANANYKTGEYKVWAETNLNGMKDNYKDPSGADYTGKTITSQYSLTIGPNEPGIVVGASPASLATGDAVEISGSAEGSPASLSIWLFGPDFYSHDLVTVFGGGTYSYTIPRSTTRGLAAGLYYAVVQHPGANGVFEVEEMTEGGVTRVYDTSGNYFVSVGPGQIQGSAAATALANLIDGPAVDDACRNVSFSIEEAIIDISPILDAPNGTAIEVTGTTNLAEGNDLQLFITRQDSGSIQHTGTAQVIPDNGENVFTFTLNTGGFQPGIYCATVESIEASVNATALFTVLDGLATETPTPEPPEPAVPGVVTLDGSFESATLDPAWTFVQRSGRGRYSLTDNPGSFRYYGEGSQTGQALSWWDPTWSHPWPESSYLIRSFGGDYWTLRSSFSYHLHGSTIDGSTGAQDPHFVVVFGDGTGPKLDFQRCVDYWYGLSVLGVNLQNTLGGDPMSFPDADFRAADDIYHAIGSDGWIDHTYRYEIARNGREVTVGLSTDGTAFTPIRSFTLPATTGATQRMAFYLSEWAPVGSYTDIGGVTVWEGTFFDLVPIARDDTYTTREGQTLAVPAPGLLANDAGVNASSIAAVTTSPSHGSLTLNEDGSFAYVPEAGYSGTDSFAYTLRTGEQVSPAATVTITVAPNPPPTTPVVPPTTPVVPPPTSNIPVASFTIADGPVPWTFVFNDTSTNAPTSWYWDFGDGTNSTERNPTHAYAEQPGAGGATFSVSLTATNVYGSNTSVQGLWTASLEVGLTANVTDGTAPMTVRFWTTGPCAMGDNYWDFGDGTLLRTGIPDTVHTYTSPGTYEVGITQVRAEHMWNTDNLTIIVRADPTPVANFTWSPDAPVALATVSFADTSIDDGGVVTWAWDFGDGVTSGDANPSHQYSGAGAYPVTLTVTDADGRSASVTKELVVGYRPPAAGFGFAPTSITAGDTVSFTDASTVHEGSIAIWNWSFGDGDKSSDINPSHAYPAAGTYTVALNVTDSNGGSGTAYWPLVVNAPGETTFALVPPATVEEGRVTIETGATAQESVTVAGDTIEVAMNNLTMTIVTDGLTVGDGTVEGDIVSVSVETDPVLETFSDAGEVAASFDAVLSAIATSYDITASITDTADSEVASAYELVARDSNLEILDIAYVFNIAGTSGMNVVDANITMTADKAWVEAMDGADNVTIFRRADGGDPEVLKTTYTYDDPIYTFTGYSPNGLSVFGLAGTRDSRPAVESVAVTPNPLRIGEGATLTATVDDTLSGDSPIVSVDYSLDGTTWHPMAPAIGALDEPRETVTAVIPAFAAPTVAGVWIRAQDGDEVKVVARDQVLLAVFDPEGGFVTGGGWIASPAGAYAPDPGLTGKANFGFVSKYRKGANLPSGDTQFVFSAADFTFRSTSYDWLVVAGAKAQYKGSGTVNDAGDYGFMLTAVDGEASEKSKPDLFRLKVWSKATGTVVYDNQMGAPDTDDPATVIGGGEIVVHKA